MGVLPSPLCFLGRALCAQLLDVDRPQDRLAVHGSPDHQVADDRNRRDQVQQGTGPGSNNAAVDLVIAAAREVGSTKAQDLRHVVIHAQFARPDQLEAFARIGLAPTFFTVHTFFFGDQHRRNTGDRADFISPINAHFEAE